MAGRPTASKPPARKTTSGASQLGKVLSTQGTRLRGAAGPAVRRLRAEAGPRARRLGQTVRTTVLRLGPARVAAAVAAVVVLGLVAWWLTSLAASKHEPTAGAASAAAPSAPASAEASTPPSPAARGALPLEGVNPMDFQLGDCFKDFDASAPTATVVACSSGHSAQLIAVDRYGADDAYPGRDPLKQKALDTCKSAPLTDKSASYDFSYKLAYPSASSWNSGDRRVDCYFVADGGNVIKESLIPRL